MQLNDRYCRYIFRKIADSLHKLHSNGVAHRDIKPENIMLTPDYEIMLVDLGYGIPLSGRDGTYFMTSLIGTPMYKAPEILAAKPY